MIRRGRRNSYRMLRRLILFVVSIYAIYYCYGRWFAFNPQEILENSILKDRNFTVKVEEIISPRHKIKAYLYHDTTNPIIAINFMFKNAGWASEDEQFSGTTAMLESLLVAGAGKYNAEAFSEQLESHGISMGFSSSKDDFSGSLMTTKQDQDLAFELLTLVLTTPKLAPEEINRVRRQVTEYLKKQKENPEVQLELAFAKELYGKHPYGRNSFGTEESLRRIKKATLYDFVKKNFSLTNLVVGVAGDISPEELGGILDKIFGALPEKAATHFVRRPDVCFEARTQNVDRKTAQNIAMFAIPGVERNHVDFYPLYVANHIFGGSGLVSRLSHAAREKEGLTYGISTGLATNEKSPLIMGGFSATPDNFHKVIDILYREWDDFVNNGATEQEVREAKDYLLATHNLKFSSISGISFMMMLMQRENLGSDFLQKRNSYVEKVTPQEVNEAIKKYFDRQKLIQVNIGNFAK